MALTITLLGTGNPIPDAHRAGPATLVQGAGTNLLIDSGRGVLQRLVAAGVLPPMLHAVLITHLHSDHITDLNDVITTHWVMTMEPTPLRIFGPPGTAAVVGHILASLAPDISYRLAHHADLTWSPDVQVTEVAPGDVFTLGTATIRVAATDHRPVEPTVAYRIEVAAADGALDDFHAHLAGEVRREAEETRGEHASTHGATFR